MLYLFDGWQDNTFTVLAELLRERVHGGERTIGKDGRVERNLTVYSKRARRIWQNRLLRDRQCKGGGNNG